MSIPERLVATAPCRVDFAGGTLDLWPIAPFLGGATTVNHAIGLRPRVELRPHDGERSLAISLDLDLRLVIEDETPPVDEGPLALIALAVRALPPPAPVSLTIQSPVPKGSGLGASSTILIATLAALAAARGEAIAPRDLVALARDLEARLIHVPTGTQDYWSAVRGGLNIIEFRPGDAIGQPADQAMPKDLRRRLADELLILFTGEAHFSAAPNWTMLRAIIEEKDGATGRLFQAIAAAASEAARAIRQGDRDGLAAAIAAEWASRRQLSEAVAPRRLAEVMDRLDEAGADAVKLCGAGGGGTLIALVPAERRDAVRAIAEEHGFQDLGRGLDDCLDDRGLTVEVG